jgi:two-component system response regulator CpxR
VSIQSTVLIVDDDVELGSLLREYFEAEDLRVRLAHDGRAGLDEARKPGVDLIVLDVMMPELNGMEVLKELRKESGTPVIMLTARGIRHRRKERNRNRRS